MKAKHKKFYLLPAACALGAGLLNGLLGTGGGVALWFAATRRQERKKAFATSATGVLFLSVESLLLSPSEAFSVIKELTPLFLLFALLGGATGGLLLGKIPVKLLNGIFAFLLIGSGVFVLIKELFF